AVRALPLHYDLDGPAQHSADLVAKTAVIDHAVHFAEEKGAEAVTVHGPVGVVALGEITWNVRRLLIQDVAQRPRDLLAVESASGQMPARHERQRSQAGDGDVSGILAGAPESFGALLGGKILQPALDGLLGIIVDHALGLGAIG